MCERKLGFVAAVAAVLVMAFCQAAQAQTHAPWPTDWNNWNDPALWCTVGNPGNAGLKAGGDMPPGRFGPARVCGAVAYTFQIGKFEVTAGQYTAFLNAVAATDTYGLYNPNMWSDAAGCRIQQSGASGRYTYAVASDYANRPVNFVSWADSLRFVNWVSNGQRSGAQDASTTEDGSYAMTEDDLAPVTRKANATYVIPTEDEWYKAAYYKGGSTKAGYWGYPMRSSAIPGNDMADLSGNNANYALSSVPIDSGKYTTVVGEFQNSASPYGTFDQAGNVWEWNEGTVYDSGDRGTKGGGYSSASAAMFVVNRFASPVASETAFTGFRIAYIPEPASLSLLALGGLAVLRKRRAALTRPG